MGKKGGNQERKWERIYKRENKEKKVIKRNQRSKSEIKWIKRKRDEGSRSIGKGGNQES